MTNVQVGALVVGGIVFTIALLPRLFHRRKLRSFQELYDSMKDTPKYKYEEMQNRAELAEEQRDELAEALRRLVLLHDMTAAEVPKMEWEDAVDAAREVLERIGK